LTHRGDSKRHTTTTYASYSGAGGAGGASYGTNANTSTVAYSSGAGAGAVGATNFSQTSDKQETLQYEHNRVAMIFLIPSLLSVFLEFESPYPLQTLLFLLLACYGLDMANAREFLSVFLWVSAVIVTLVSGWFLLLATPDDDTGGLTTLSVLLRTTGNGFLFLCTVRNVTQRDAVLVPTFFLLFSAF